MLSIGVKSIVIFIQLFLKLKEIKWPLLKVYFCLKPKPLENNEQIEHINILVFVYLFFVQVYTDIIQVKVVS